MRLSEMLAPERIAFAPTALEKRDALGTLARLLAKGCSVPEESLRRALREREELQSTGIGEGVAIPHAAVAELDHPVAALLLVPAGLDFGAIDDAKVHHIFAVVGPKREVGEHLRTLARISKLLRSAEFRARLLGSLEPAAAFELVSHEEQERAG